MCRSLSQPISAVHPSNSLLQLTCPASSRCTRLQTTKSMPSRGTFQRSVPHWSPALLGNAASRHASLRVQALVLASPDAEREDVLTMARTPNGLDTLDSGITPPTAHIVQRRFAPADRIATTGTEVRLREALHAWGRAAHAQRVAPLLAGNGSVQHGEHGLEADAVH